MSADRWSECPMCKKNVNDLYIEKMRVAEASYGNVSAAEYAKLVKEANTPPEFGETLQQDWGLGIDDTGLFEISYYASCKKCGFEYQFEESEDALAKRNKP